MILAIQSDELSAASQGVRKLWVLGCGLPQGHQLRASFEWVADKGPKSINAFAKLVINSREQLTLHMRGSD